MATSIKSMGYRGESDSSSFVILIDYLSGEFCSASGERQLYADVHHWQSPLEAAHRISGHTHAFG